MKINDGVLNIAQVRRLAPDMNNAFSKYGIDINEET